MPKQKQLPNGFTIVGNPSFKKPQQTGPLFLPKGVVFKKKYEDLIKAKIDDHKAKQTHLENELEMCQNSCDKLRKKAYDDIDACVLVNDLYLARCKATYWMHIFEYAIFCYIDGVISGKINVDQNITALVNYEKEASELRNVAINLAKASNMVNDLGHEKAIVFLRTKIMAPFCFSYRIGV